MRTHDAIGRATFHHIEYRCGIRPTQRETRWLKFIERHGPQSSLYLHELTSDTHRDRDTSLRQLQKLRSGDYLTCPVQQRATENASFNPYIYELTPRARAWLEGNDLAENTIRPSGHWVHQYMVSCITASIDISLQRSGMSYIPAHAILERSGSTLSVELGRKKLTPDQLFGIDYGGRYRFFCVEADRGSEPKDSKAARKSYRSMIEDYANFIGDGVYKQHFGLTAGMLLLCVFSSKTNERRFLETVRAALGKRSAYILTQTVPGFHGCFRPPELFANLANGGWARAGQTEFVISDT
ncbi:replication-relaxation family protein [Oricola indica]|uniref:replication-relaxation family protein n=1 Tax=Oricola indica TaxID=2872591 RepID=UPI003CCB886F